jgi:hypothetical protein
MRKLLPIALMLLACGEPERDIAGSQGLVPGQGGAGTPQRSDCEAVWYCLHADCLDLYQSGDYYEDFIPCRDDCMEESESDGEARRAVEAFMQCLTLGFCDGC